MLICKHNAINYLLHPNLGRKLDSFLVPIVFLHLKLAVMSVRPNDFALVFDIKISLKMIDVHRVNAWWWHTAITTACRKPWEMQYDDFATSFILQILSNLVCLLLVSLVCSSCQCSGADGLDLVNFLQGFFFSPVHPCLAISGKERKAEIF